MVKRYARRADNPTKSAKAKGSYLRVHFKNTAETARCIKGMTVERAKEFLDNVIHHKECVAFRHYNGGVGRTGQAKQHGTCTQGRWPKKSVEFISTILKNAEANAESKGLDNSQLVISHLLVNRAPKQRRRTYRAHGRINPYMSNPSHIEMIVTEKNRPVPLPKDGKVVVSRRVKGNARLSNGLTA